MKKSKETDSTPANVTPETDNSKKSGFHRKLAKRTNLIIFVAVAVVAFVLLNLVAQFIPNIDSTTGGIFTLTDISKKVLSELDSNVTIYALFDRVEGEAETGPGKRAEQVLILDLYDKYPRVSVEYVDLDRNPSFLLKTVGEQASSNYKKNDFIVKCGDNIRHLTSTDLYATETQTYQYYYQYEVTVGIQAETKFTSAIIKVTGEIPVICYSTGFGEMPRKNYSSSILEYIENNGFDVEEIDIRTSDIPEEAACMIFMGPTQDLTGEARDKLDRWLKAGHSAFFFMDVKSIYEDKIIYNDFENFGEILVSYGISLEKTLVEETDDVSVSGSEGQAFKAKTRGVGAFEKLESTEIYIMNTRSLNLDNMTDTAEAEPLIQTSKNAKAVAIENENDSRSGISVVAASGKKDIGVNTSRIVVFGSSGTYSDAALGMLGSDAPQKTISAALRWMDLEVKSNVADSIQAKAYNNGVKTAVVISENAMRVHTIIVMIAIPLLILGAGFAVWLTRRFK